MKRTLDKVVLGLTLLGEEFIIKHNNKIIFVSQKYDQILKSAVNKEVYTMEHNFFELNVKTITIDDEVYSLEILRDITKYYIIALEQKEENVILKEDEVTGLPNRNEVQNYIKKIEKNSQTRIFVLCDIDNFKHVNDIYGHQIGDLVLKRVGDSLKKNIRKTDFAGRYGGEEFIMIFDTDRLDIVLSRINEVRLSILTDKELIDINLSDLTFSAGIAYCGEVDSPTKVIKNADLALYLVKENGKNGNAVYNPILNMPEMTPNSESKSIKYKMKKKI